MGGGNTFVMEYAGGYMKDYEMRLLAEGACGAFLPTSFVLREGLLETCYDYTGYVPFTDWDTGNIEKVLTLIERAGICLANSMEYLIIPERLTLSGAVIFVSEPECAEDRTGLFLDVKIAYIPRAENSEKRGFMEELIAELVMRFSAIDTYGHLKRLLEYIKIHNPSPIGIVNKACELKRELYSSGWDREC